MNVIKILLYLFCLLLFGCKINKIPQDGKNECEVCNELFGDYFFVDYPIGKFRIGNWKRKGLVESSRNIPAAKKRIDKDGNLRIVNEAVINLIHKYKFCFIGYDYDDVNSSFDKRIRREVSKPDTMTIVLDLCFDFGKLSGNQSLWFDYECLSFSFKKEKKEFVYKGSELELKNYKTCGRDINFLEDKFNEKIRKKRN